MAYELDDIRAQTDCMVCEQEINVPYSTLRLRRTIECPGCGETIRLIDATPIGAVQKLIEDTGKQ